MNEQLITGYTAYTTADEYGAAATDAAPATAITTLAVALSLGIAWLPTHVR
ncbi:LxmA leader domain family RiPP [Streptomyces sp. NPDC048506]|uniref:LxmA leader domain family RiPP n=1 Tax=Streptomyces sp. NPDC048506 TaxID=3155028 RepID=UPI003443608C